MNIQNKDNISFDQIPIFVYMESGDEGTIIYPSRYKGWTFNIKEMLNEIQSNGLIYTSIGDKNENTLRNVTNINCILIGRKNHKSFDVSINTRGKYASIIIQANTSDGQTIIEFINDNNREAAQIYIDLDDKINNFNNEIILTPVIEEVNEMPTISISTISISTSTQGFLSQKQKMLTREYLGKFRIHHDRITGKIVIDFTNEKENV